MRTLPRPQACGVKNVISVAKSGTEDVLKKDPAAEKAPDAGAVDSDKAKAMFAAHAPRPSADFWSKFTRPTGPPTAPTGAVKGALKKDIPAATSGAEASVDETGAIKNDPALKPVTKVVTALKPAAAGGAPPPARPLGDAIRGVDGEAGGGGDDGLRGVRVRRHVKDWVDDRREDEAESVVAVLARERSVPQQLLATRAGERGDGVEQQADGPALHAQSTRGGRGGGAMTQSADSGTLDSGAKSILRSRHDKRGGLAQTSTHTHRHTTGAA